MSWKGNIKIREEKRTMVKELEEVITKKATDYYYRKDYSTLSLLIIPKGKTARESIFHVEIGSGLVQCHLHESFKTAHFEFLKQKGYVKRRNTSVVKFDTIHSFSHFLEEIK